MHSAVIVFSAGHPPLLLCGRQRLDESGKASAVRDNSASLSIMARSNARPPLRIDCRRRAFGDGMPWSSVPTWHDPPPSTSNSGTASLMCLSALYDVCVRWSSTQDGRISGRAADEHAQQIGGCGPVLHECASDRQPRGGGRPRGQAQRFVQVLGVKRSRRDERALRAKHARGWHQRLRGPSVRTRDAEAALGALCENNRRRSTLNFPSGLSF